MPEVRRQVTTDQKALVDKILARYAVDFPSLRELIQNADDAGAERVCVTLHLAKLPSGSAGDPLPPNQIAKKKVWEAVQPHLSTNGECVALYKELPFETAHGPCTVATIKEGGIK